MTDINTITTSATSAAAKQAVLNLRLDDETKIAIAREAIRDGRSMSQIALRAIKLGLAQMIAPTPSPVVEAPAPTPKAKSKGKGGKGGKGGTGSAPAKPKGKGPKPAGGGFGIA